MIAQCSQLRSSGATLDDLTPVGGVDLAEPTAFATRLTPILYEKLRGNPRRIKRFLNDMRVRQSVASRRGIALAPEIVAKLMVLEQLVPDGFDLIMDWIAHGNLRGEIAALELAAGRPVPEESAEPVDAVAEDGAAPSEADEGKVAPEPPTPESEFADDLLRWAKLPPSLTQVDLTPYLHLAASFSRRTLIDTELPERLRDIAANLLSSSRAEQRAVTNDDSRATSERPSPVCCSGTWDVQLVTDPPISARRSTRSCGSIACIRTSSTTLWRPSPASPLSKSSLPQSCSLTSPRRTHSHQC